MQQRDGDEARAEQLRRSVQHVGRHLRHSPKGRVAAKDVVEGPADGLNRFAAAVNGDRALLVEIEGSDVVQPQDVVRVGMREQHGIQPRQASAQGLEAEVRCGVNDHVAPSVLHQERRTGAFVARILGKADAAAATNGGHAQ